MKIGKTIRKIPFIGNLIIKTYLQIKNPNKFTNSAQFWDDRYKNGGNSGAGSYNHLAEFKGEIINKFVEDNDIFSVIEFGCGDGNQLKYFNFKSYIGFDVSPQVIKIIREIFNNDESKKFKLMNDYANETADLTLSLDVIYHLIEDNVFSDYMTRLFSASNRYVIIYASNYNEQLLLNGKIAHVRHRKFTDWIEENQLNFKLIEFIPNRYPIEENNPASSFADFYIFEKQA